MGDTSPSAKIHTVPASRAFLESVAKGLIDKCGGDPLSLADHTILVPDSATAMRLRQAFTAQGQGAISILPKIEALGAIDADSLSLRIADDAILSQALMDMPPPVSRLERQLVLAGEILKMKGMASSVHKAVKLGAELGNLLDDFQRNNIELTALDGLVPPQYQKQWEKTASFLKVITEAWPAHLEKIGRVDPEEHRNAVMRVRALHWQNYPTQKPVLAVGFTDAAPAAMAILQSVAALPQGQIVFQGFDPAIDQKSWEALTDIHPQAGFKRILEAVGAAREDVAEWEARVEKTQSARAVNPEQTNAARQKLLREAMRPAATSEGWSSLVVDPQALNGIDMITCGSPQEEASVIALKMRETLEVKGRSAALVTADRALARRVSARLKHWHIDVPDSAGLSLAETPVGIFLYASANMAAEDWAPVPLLEALKHPLSALGDAREQFSRKLTMIEDKLLHGPRPAGGAEGLKHALSAVFNRAARRRTPEPQLPGQRQEMEQLIERLDAAGQDFFARARDGKPHSFTDLLEAHIRFCETLAQDDAQSGADRLWRGDDGVTASRFLTSLRASAQCMPPVTGRDYADVLQGLMRDVPVRNTAAPHPLLKILTPEQAIQTKTDIVIMGGLNDEVWPSRGKDNPWLSPDMLQKLGLPGAEAGIGRDAHHFIQALSSPNVLMTRAVRSGDAPTVASPFLTRLLMVLKAARVDKALESKTQLLDIHIAMHTPQEVTPIEPPAPTPPAALRPRELPVTAIEGLMRDPYGIYAKYILKLRPKSPLDANPNAADRGTLTHAALEKFVDSYPDRLPDNAYDELLRIGRETFQHHLDNPTVQSFWWPRFERIAHWFVRFEAERRDMTRTLGTEVRGKLEIDLGDGVFTLTTIADRVDINAQDQMEIVDYKTGTVPSQKSVALGFSPQLTLEALIGFTGGFSGIDAGDVGSLQYWKLSGGRPAADVTEVKGDVRQLVDEAREGVTNLMRAFNDDKTPYLATPRPEWAPRYNNYEHLSRVGEWSTVKKVSQKKARNKTAPRRKGK